VAGRYISFHQMQAQKMSHKPIATLMAKVTQSVAQKEWRPVKSLNVYLRTETRRHTGTKLKGHAFIKL
jgi:hypothetical protein